MALVFLKCERCGAEILTIQDHNNGCFRPLAEEAEIAETEFGEACPWALSHVADGGTMIVSRKGN